MTAVKSYIDIEFENNRVYEVITFKLLVFLLFFCYPLFNCIFVKNKEEQFSVLLDVATFTMLFFLMIELLQIKS